MLKKSLLLFLVLNIHPILAANLNVEEKRISKAESELKDIASRYDDLIADFEYDIGYINNYDEYINIINQYGNKVWKANVADNQAKLAIDDRPLYWARLKMSKVIKQSRLNFSLNSKQYQSLFANLERASRGHNDVNFSVQVTKKILITGFDPFFLDRNIGQSNPSGLAALMLDGKTIKVEGESIQIESAIFPVRFEDFDQGEVEHFLKPYFSDNSVDMIVTISMGREDFDLERFPALRRSAKAPGNLNVFTGADKANPLTPLIGSKPLKGPEFVEFSLPVDAMVTIQTPYKVNDRRTVTTTEKQFEPQSLTELEGKTSVEGSGGGYLSNEISYRSINLRNKYKSNIPVGHLHTPRIKGYEPELEKKIVQQIEKILIAGALSL